MDYYELINIRVRRSFYHVNEYQHFIKPHKENPCLMAPSLSYSLFNLLPMNLHIFKTMSEEMQHRNLLLNGACIADRKSGKIHVLLFQLHSFYVEVSFNEDGDEVVETRSFEDVDELDPYLSQIDLHEIQ